MLGLAELTWRTSMTKAVLPETGYLRVSQILQLIPVGKSSWWKGVSAGRYPQPVKLGPKTTAWRIEDIRALIERLSG